MAIDNTALFRTCVKTAKALNSNLGADVNVSKLILKSHKKNAFISQSTDIVKQVSKLKEFILQHRKAYLNFTPSFVNTDQMTDEERDNIDARSQEIIISCQQLVASLKNELKSFKSSSQALENNQIIIEFVENYLKTVCKIIREQTSMRNRWRNELQKITSIDPAVPLHAENPERVPESNKSSSKKSSFFNPASDSANNSDLTEEELQVFELENELLYNDLNSMNEEVRAIQTKVVKIAQLQEEFTEKVMEQNEDLERINTTLVGTTENIKDANQQIREAIQTNAGLRIYLLFFLLVMSFSLLFLDWYND